MVNCVGYMLSPPVIRDGVRRRGVMTLELPATAVPHIRREDWVLLQCRHWAQPPVIDGNTDLYQIDPFYASAVPPGQWVAAIPRDFANPDVFRPLPDVPKQYDVIMNACWHPIKRHELLLRALQHSAAAGRRLTALLFGYHWSSGGNQTSQALEERIRCMAGSLLKDQVTFADVCWDGEEINRRYNAARINVLTSRAEAGPRVMSEGMLAGLPYVCMSDVSGGSIMHVSPSNGLTAKPGIPDLCRTIWHALDHLGSFQPREWALQHMCKPVTLARLRRALESLASNRGWSINCDDLNYDGQTPGGWFDAALSAQNAIPPP